MAHARPHVRKVTLVLASVAGVSLLSGCGVDRPFDGSFDHPFGLGRAPTPQVEAAQKLHQCASCHADNGISSAEIFPNLAGQQKDYLVVQLTAFRQRTRKDRNAKSYMWGMATGLSDGAIKILAADYAAKTPAGPSPHVKGDLVAGKAIFENGVAARGVLACASCHGAGGEGNAVIPRLIGQKQDYLVVQLHAYASGSRENAQMKLVAKAMTPADIKAVASYLASR
jgi:cytochrome c553